MENGSNILSTKTASDPASSFEPLETRSVLRILSCLLALVVWPGAASAGTLSLTGSLTSPEDSTSGQILFTLAADSFVTLQTWSFGGGRNAAGATIAAGGFDPFVGVFAGTGDSAVFIDGSSDVLTNYSSDQGCAPAGQVKIGGLVCGDVKIGLNLTAGIYTLLLTDAPYLPAAVFEQDGTLGDGFVDLTGGAFQTCNGSICVNDTANWALDIRTSAPLTSAPEPSTLLAMLVSPLPLVIAAAKRRFSTAK
jgi:hypothetical protein